MNRDDETPELPKSPPAFAAGWAVAGDSPQIALEAMAIVEESLSAPPVSDSPSVSVGWAGDSAGIEPSAGERFDIAGPLGGEADETVFASALMDEPQSAGLRYLLNYAHKSIRKNRGVQEQDRDDLLHEIYMEWWVCTGREVEALPKLLDAESPERQSLRESIYRVFGRYRYHQTAHRTQDLAENDSLTPQTPAEGESRDFTLDMEKWLKILPENEAKVIDLYYFQHKTMEEIGLEMGLAKQRVSEMHKRALARHPDANSSDGE